MVKSIQALQYVANIYFQALQATVYLQVLQHVAKVYLQVLQHVAQTRRSEVTVDAASVIQSVAALALTVSCSLGETL